MLHGNLRVRRERRRVVIGDSQLVFRLGLRIILESTPYFKVVGEAKDEDSAITLCESLAPDVAILALGQANFDGLHSARAIKTLVPDAHVVMLTAYHDKARFAQLRDIGVSAIIWRGISEDSLVDRIQQVCCGERFIDTIPAHSQRLDRR